MNKELKLLIDKLINSLPDNIIDCSYEITDELERKENTFEVVEPILKIFEANPYVNFGSPGPIVHFVERFYKNGYEEKLLDSLNRRPTDQTLWMLNRVINGADHEKKQYYLTIVDNLISKFSADKEIVERAQYFKSLHG
jgi:hypothetical protein